MCSMLPKCAHARQHRNSEWSLSPGCDTDFLLQARLTTAPLPSLRPGDGSESCDPASGGRSPGKRPPFCGAFQKSLHEHELGSAQKGLAVGIMAPYPSHHLGKVKGSGNSARRRRRPNACALYKPQHRGPSPGTDRTGSLTLRPQISKSLEL